MNTIVKLAKTFIKSSSMSKPTDRGQKIKILVLSLFAMFGIMLPVVVGIGVVVKVMTETLTPVGFGDFGFELMLYITCIFTVVFGINILFSELYFAGDIEHILPLPLRAYQVVGGKFFSVYYMENIMQFMMVASCIIGYAIGAQLHIGKLILALVGMVILPMMPLAVCGIVSILIMGCTRIIKSKDIIHRMTIALSFIVLIVVVVSITSLQTLDLEKVISEMAAGSDSSLRGLRLAFINVSLYVKAVAKGDILAFLGYLMISVVSVGIMLFVGERLYFRGVIGVSELGKNKKAKSVDVLLDNCKQRSKAYAYFIKELRLLVRTPAYFTNCIAVNFIWPIFVYAVYKIKGLNFNIEELRVMYSEDKGNMQLLVLVGIVGISIILTALNSISSNSLSREGKHFAFMKYIPVSYKIQWHVKALVGGMFSAIGVMIFFIPACIAIRVPMLHVLVYVIISLLAILLVSYIGIYIDSIQPKLIWEDELNSLRENYNTFFSMAIAIALVAIISVGGYFLFKSQGSMWPAVGAITGVLIILGVLVALMTKKNMITYIESQEEC